MTTCPTCGARYTDPGDSCDARFDALLALDHSRREPWGSRHGLAASAFWLQHPDRCARAVLERSWLFLFSDADAFPERLDAWCRGALDGWRG